MLSVSKILYKLPLLLLLALSPIISFSQKTKRIELKQANTLEYDRSLGENVKRLIGNVIFEHEQVRLYCDSAYLYSSDSLDAYGNVHIQQGDSVNIYSDFLKYNGTSKKAELQGNIRLTEKEMLLTTNMLSYDINTSVAYYTNGGKIVNKDNTLTSQIALYYSKNKEFFFKKDVVLYNPQYIINCDTLRYNSFSKIAYFIGPTTIKSDANFIYCENGWYNTQRDISEFGRNAYIISKEQKLKGDTLYYDRKKGMGNAFGNIQIVDTAQNLTIKGDYAEYLEKGEKSFVKGNALLTQTYEKDTLFLHADLLRTSTDVPKKDTESTSQDSLKEERNRTLFAYNKVKFFKSDLQGKCDSLVFTYSDSTMRFYTEPVLWSDKNQLTADTMEMQTKKGAINRIKLLHNALIVSQEDSSRYNQIQGKKMTGFFEKNELYKIYVEGNGQSIYYAKDEKKWIGVNKVVCSDILIFLKNKEVEKVTFITKPEATLYPLEELNPNELLLKNFKWRAKERPSSKEDIFIW